MSRPRHIARGVELFPARTPTLPPATHTNSYALGEAEVLLVEPATPYEDERREWLAWARGFAGQGRRLLAIFLTHHHSDHVGGAEFFSRELDIPIWAHDATASRLPDLAIARRIADAQTIVLGGPAPQRFRALHTPGHAPGHLCLHEEDSGIAIVGDMVASQGTILIDPVDGDMAEYLKQLDRLASVGASVALPAHGEPIDNPTGLFRHYIAHRLAREAKVLAALGDGAARGKGLDELVPVVYADTPAFLWPLGRLSLQAHLIKLEREGRAARTGLGWAVAVDSGVP